MNFIYSILQFLPNLRHFGSHLVWFRKLNISEHCYFTHIHFPEIFRIVLKSFPFSVYITPETVCC